MIRPPLRDDGDPPPARSGGTRIPDRPRLLFATPVGHDPSDALRRAGALCDVLETELFVVRLVSRSSQSTPYDDRLSDESAGDDRILRATRRWCEVALDGDLPNGLEVARGESFASALVRATRTSRAAFVVIPHTRNGWLVRQMVRDTGVPLLVARRPRGTDAVVAATDLSAPRYPVLREAMRLARGLVAPAVFMHNAPPGPRSRDSRRSRNPAPRQRAVDWLSAFAAAEDALGAKCTRIVLSRRSTVGAISEVAALKRADLIVVGTHICCDDGNGTPHVSVAARIVARTMGSVLVVPISSPNDPVDVRSQA